MVKKNDLKIIINLEYYLSEPTESDIPSFIKHLSEKQIYRNTLQIPCPYLKEDGVYFIERVKQRKKDFGRLMDWGIRNTKGALIGMISFQGKYKDTLEKDQIGFWLGKPFWGNGIMTEVLKRFTAFGFDDFKFSRLELEIFTFNEASSRLAEKCGFQFEHIIPEAYWKDQKMIDAKMYAIEKPLGRTH